MRSARLVPVAAGAVVGAGLRWVALRVGGPSGADAALLAVNVVGSLVLGLVIGAPDRTWAGSERGRDLLVAGFCGALTSWSALALQLAGETRAGEWWTASGWLVAHLVLGTGAATVGWWAVRRAAGR